MNRKRALVFSFLIFTLLVINLPLKAEEVEELKLVDAIRISLEKNDMIQSSKLDIKKAESDLDKAWRNFWPKLDLQTSYTRLDEAPIIPGMEWKYNPIVKQPLPIPKVEEGSPNNYNTQLKLQQPILMGTRAIIGVDLAKKGVELSKIQAEQTINDTLFQTIQSYFNLLMAEDMVQIRANAIKLIEEHQRIVEANFDAGMVLKTDILKVKIEKRKAKQELKTAQDNLHMAARQLAQQLGLSTTDFQIANPDLEPEIDLKLDKLYQQAFRNRPELESMQVNQEMLQTNLKMEKRSKWPNIMLLGNYSWQGEELSFEDGSWNITLSASMNIFDGGLSKKKQEGLELQLDKLNNSKESTKDMIKLDLEQALLKTKQAADSLNLQQLSLENAKESLRLANESYKAGVGTNLDVINAQTTLRQTEISLMQARYQYKLSKFKLIYKTGLLMDYCEEVLNGEN